MEGGTKITTMKILMVFEIDKTDKNGPNVLFSVGFVLRTSAVVEFITRVNEQHKK